jgi:hypothetical protein
LHADKRDLADRLLEGTSSASTLSLEELLELIGSDELAAKPAQASDAASYSN